MRVYYVVLCVVVAAAVYAACQLLDALIPSV